MPKAFEMVRLAPEEIHFERRGDTLAMNVGETLYPRVILRCCFPVSQEQFLLSVRDATGEEQEEIGIIEDWALLRDEDRQAVAAELGLHYFVPQIQRVLRIKDEFGFLYWTIETDKGPRDFVMRNSVVHYAREVGPNHWLLIDVNQARYEIPDLTKLDVRSQALVKRFLYL